MAFYYDPWASDDEDEYMFDYEFDADALFDDDLYEFMLDDYADSMDSDYSDIQDNTKIFLSLLDSNVVHGLNFHKDLEWGMSFDPSTTTHRLPRLKLGVKEHYENVVKLLDELELLIRVWKRRTQHALTAHIEQEANCVRTKEDKEEDEDDEWEDNDSHFRQEVNMALTKKKFCTSTIIYNLLFGKNQEDEEQKGSTDNVKSSGLSFDSFYDSIRQARKLVRKTALTNFLNALEPDVHHFLPTEVWELIWHHTQRPFAFGEKDVLRMGLREKINEERSLLEQNRLNDLFAAIGHLHMLIFEILFKHPHLIRHPPLDELVAIELKRKLDPRAPLKHNFMLHYNMFLRALHRWSSCITEEEKHHESKVVSSISERIQCGLITFRASPLLSENTLAFVDDLALVYESKEPPTLSLWTRTQSDSQCLRSFECMQEDVLSSIIRTAPFATSSILDFNENYVVLTNIIKIKTGKKSPLAEEEIALIIFDLKNKTSEPKRFTVKGIELSAGQRHYSKIVSSEDKEKNSILLVIDKTLQILNLEETSRNCADMETKAETKTLATNVDLMAANRRWALVVDASARQSFTLIDLENQSQVLTLKAAHISEEAGHNCQDDRVRYFAAFDDELEQLAIFSQNLTAYRLYDVSGNPPFKVIAKGSTVHFGFSNNISTFRRGPVEGVTLYRGHLFILAPPTSTAYPASAVELSVVNLRDEQASPLTICVVVGHVLTIKLPFVYANHDTVLEAEKVFNVLHRPLISAEKDVIKISIVWEGRVSHVFLHNSMLSVNAADGSHLVQLEEERKRREEEQKKKEEEDRILAAKLEEERYRKWLGEEKYKDLLVEKENLLSTEKREKFVGTGVRFTGTIVNWIKSYGFIKVLGEDPFPFLVFCHIKAFVGVRPARLGSGDRVEFEVEESRDRIRVQAAKAKFLGHWEEGKSKNHWEAVEQEDGVQ